MYKRHTANRAVLSNVPEAGPEAGLTLFEVLAASIIILIILAAIVGSYHISVLQSFEDIVDTEVRVVGRSIEDGLRAGAKFNIAANRRSFFADVEGVRIFVPLPQTGQPPVDLPDYNEDTNGNWATVPTLEAADIDWDEDGVLDAPAAARFPNTPESFTAIGVGGRSQAYDGANDDSGQDQVIDDKALYIFPYGLLSYIEDGIYKELITGTGTIAWDFSGTSETVAFILSPLEEDLNDNGFIPTTGPGAEAALNWNAVPIIGLSAFYPDTFEDLNGDGRITASVSPSLQTIRNINGDGTNGDINEYAEDFNFNGFLDVPSRSPLVGSVYSHIRYNAQTADPLSEGILANANPNYGAPLQSANYSYAAQIQPGRNFGYTLSVENLEQRPGLGVGFGRVAAQRFQITVSVYYDYAVSLREFQAGRNPTPIRVQRFELEIP